MHLQLLLHRISYRIRCFHAAATSDELISIIEEANPLEPELDAMVPFLSPPLSLPSSNRRPIRSWRRRRKKEEPRGGLATPAEEERRNGGGWRPQS
ncbi:unnamed protein product [Linum trigynum]|uniref:Uncharacterized protein n=1 Tax=Linum trigynum TaxID=586398 RepID=A0AAV2CS88_9ROSI